MLFFSTEYLYKTICAPFCLVTPSTLWPGAGRNVYGIISVAHYLFGLDEKTASRDMEWRKSIQRDANSCHATVTPSLMLVGNSDSALASCLHTRTKVANVYQKWLFMFADLL